MKKIEIKKRFKKGSVLIEALIGLVVVATIVTASYTLFSGKKEDAIYKNTMDNFLQSFHEGMLKYSIDSIHANNNFANVTTKTAVTFMNPSLIALSDDGTYITPKHSNLKDLIKVTVLSAQDPNNNNNRRYKAMFDLRPLASANGWDASNSDDAQKFQKIETEVARFFKNITSDVVISGEATSLGTANSNTGVSEPNSDGIVIIDRVN